MAIGSKAFPPDFDEVEFGNQLSELYEVDGDELREVIRRPRSDTTVVAVPRDQQVEPTESKVKVEFDDHQILGIELLQGWKALPRRRCFGANLTVAVRATLISPAPQVASQMGSLVTNDLHRVRIERIRELDRRATRAFNAVIEWLAEGSQPERRESRSGRVAVILRQGVFSEVVVDEPWASKAAAEVVAADLNEVLAGLSRRSALPAKVQQEIDAMHLVEADLVKLGNELR